MHLLPALSLLLLPLTSAHTGHSDTPDPSLTWAEQHLRSEHHILNYDAGAFFSLHDFDSNGFISRDELLRTYGLFSTDSPPPATAKDGDTIWDNVSQSIGIGSNGEISKESWMRWAAGGGVLPDFGTGVGHHGDNEWEYEIHHFEKYHGNDKEDGSDMVMHPEDVDHFAQHELEEQNAARASAMEMMPVIETNIPAKFRVQQAAT